MLPLGIPFFPLPEVPAAPADEDEGPPDESGRVQALATHQFLFFERLLGLFIIGSGLHLVRESRHPRFFHPLPHTD